MNERDTAREKRGIILGLIHGLKDEDILKGGDFTYTFRGRPGTLSFENGLPPGPPPPPPPPGNGDG